MIGRAIKFTEQNGVLVPETGEKISEYQPPQDVDEMTRQVKVDYERGDEILSRPFREFGNKSPIEEQNENQRAFLMMKEDFFDDPDEEWRWDGVRPIARNKILSMAAQLTSETLVPGVFAQNENDEEDKKMASIMKHLLEWNIRNSDYEMSFLYGVIAGLVNPVAYLSVDYIEAVQRIKVMTSEGMEVKEAVDDVMSGMQIENVPMDEVLISNPYEYHLQRQRFIFRKRYIEYDQARRMFGDHKLFKFVRPGWRTIFAEETETYYDQKDDQLDTLCEYAVYYNRERDLEVPYLNGIYVGDKKVQNNRITHRDQEMRPKYPLVKFGSEPIDEKNFFFYKSIGSKLMQDYELTNKAWRMTVDTHTLNMKPPLGIIGDEKLESDIYYPGTSFSRNEDSKIEQVPTGNPNSGHAIIEAADQQIQQSTQDPLRGGNFPQGSNTAFETARVETNARIKLGLIGKMITKAVKQVGNLMIDNIINHQTVAEVENIVGGSPKLNFRNFILPDVEEEGKTLTKEIKFEEELIGKHMDESELLKKKQELFEKEGGREGKKRIKLVNPHKFRKIKYMTTMTAESIMPKNKQLQQAINLDAYNKAIRNPLIASDVESVRNVTKDLLLGSLRPTKHNVDKYIPNKRPTQMADVPQEREENPISQQAAQSQRGGQNLTQLLQNFEQ